MPMVMLKADLKREIKLAYENGLEEGRRESGGGVGTYVACTLLQALVLWLTGQENVGESWRMLLLRRSVMERTR